MTPRDQLIDNERAKITATYLNGLAVAIFAVGGLAPLIGAVSGTVQVPWRPGRSDPILFRDELRPASCGAIYAEGTSGMTALQYASLYVMPVSGLIIAGVLYLLYGRGSSQS